MKFKRSDSNNTSEDEIQSTNPEESFKLKEKIGLWSGVSVIAGIMVGSGIFISPVGVLAGTNGSVGLSLVLWVACGIVSGLAALCYAELGTSVLESGSDYVYLNAAYGEPLAFINIITNLFLVRVMGEAAKAIVFGTYLAAPFYSGDCQPPNVVIKCAAAASLISVGLLNYVSVRVVAKVQIVFTVAKFLVMAIIIVGGFSRLAMGDPVGQQNFQNAFDSETLNGLTVSQIGLAFYQVST